MFLRSRGHVAGPGLEGYGHCNEKQQQFIADKNNDLLKPCMYTDLATCKQNCTAPEVIVKEFCLFFEDEAARARGGGKELMKREARQMCASI